jgi:CubicO group peptidase (beta-lactamase class C family)
VHDQDLIRSKGYGYADLAQRIPSTDETLYRIASVSKTFAATAVLQLAERGKLSLEVPGFEAIEAATPEAALTLPSQTRLAYSNYGHVVAGQLVAAVSGVPCARYVRENLLGPLDMTSTDFLREDGTRPGLAVPYGRRLEPGMGTGWRRSTCRSRRRWRRRYAPRGARARGNAE